MSRFVRLIKAIFFGLPIFAVILVCYIFLCGIQYFVDFLEMLINA